MACLRPSVGLFGVPWDAMSSFLRGAALAPPLLRDALASDSANAFNELGHNFHEIVKDLGDASTSELTTPSIAHAAIATKMGECLESGLAPLAMGGDHAISHPLVKTFSSFRQDKPLTIVHVDAHTDLYDVLDGNRNSHGCPFTRIMEECVNVSLIQVGIRTLTPHHRDQIKRFDVNTLPMSSHEPGPQAPIDFIRQYAAAGSDVYLSFDLDALDPAFAPGVSHHEPGGFSTRDCIAILHSLPGLGLRVVGADVVEYNPERDLNGVTAMVGAKIVKEIAGIMAEQ